MSAGVASARGRHNLFMVRVFGSSRDVWGVQAGCPGYSRSGWEAASPLAGVLESKPEQVKPAKMRQALGRTIDALRRDVTNDDPALYRALPERIEAARAADRALLSGRPAVCHRALRRFWSI